MVFDAKSFSKDLKIARYAYQYGDVIRHTLIEEYLNSLKEIDLTVYQNDTAKLAFWLNVYNGLTNYAIIKFEIKESMKEQVDFFKRPLVFIGTLEFSLDDIEHGLLRRNARAHIEKKDPKLRLMVDAIDYRIHFALNCGATSCPAIAFYTEKHLEEELTQAEISFVSQEFIVNHEEKIISCSSLFEWYRDDFENRFLNDSRYDEYEVILKEYNWKI
ncbi:DUF547 domain-containing protein [uncultured Dokdonia sp.]|uniref:DUF547 domain-containing protein n=1 Tax=uncultured Dokdonia sp. TaxID=575653 RepID=UPI00261E506B|nr:DUF547 domain-containing protein [uncultured Dokdonia sp.]